MTGAERPLRTAMVAPPYFDVPPQDYGGVEAVRRHLTLLSASGPRTTAQRQLVTAERTTPGQLGEPLDTWPRTSARS